MSDAWNSVMGGGGDSGALGMGAEAVKDPYKVNEAAFNDRTKLEEDRQRMLAEYAAAKNRTAPTAASVANVQAAQLGAARGVNAPTIAAVGPGPNTRVGAVSGPTAAALDSTQQQQFRNQQSTLTSQLADQAAGRGPSLAAAQAQASLRQSLANRVAAAATARPTGTAAATQRALAQEAAVAEAGTIGQSAQARIQEQLAAREQLNSALGTARSTDIDVAKTQAALQQEAAMKGTDVALQRSLSQADLSSREGLAAFQAERDRAMAQAQMGLDAGKFTAGAANDFALQQAQLQQQAALQNQQTAAQMSLADQEAKLKTMGMNDAQIAQMLGSSAGLTQAQYDDAMALEQLKADQAMQYEQMRLGSENAAAERRSATTGAVIGAVGGAFAAASDPRMKTDIKKVDASKNAGMSRAAMMDHREERATPTHPVETEDPDDDEKKAKLAAAFSSIGPAMAEGAARSRAARSEPTRHLTSLSPAGAKTNITATDASAFGLGTKKTVAPNSFSQFSPSQVTPELGFLPPKPMGTPGAFTPGQVTPQATTTQTEKVLVDPGHSATPTKTLAYTGTSMGGGFGGGAVSQGFDFVTPGREAVAPTYETRTTQVTGPNKTPFQPTTPSADRSFLLHPGAFGLSQPTPSNGPWDGFAAQRPSGRPSPRPFVELDGASALSDKDSKEHVTGSDKDVKHFLDELQAYEYNYKPEWENAPGAGAGPRDGDSGARRYGPSRLRQGLRQHAGRDGLHQRTPVQTRDQEGRQVMANQLSPEQAEELRKRGLINQDTYNQAVAPREIIVPKIGPQINLDQAPSLNVAAVGDTASLADQRDAAYRSTLPPGKSAPTSITPQGGMVEPPTPGLEAAPRSPAQFVSRATAAVAGKAAMPKGVQANFDRFKKATLDANDAQLEAELDQKLKLQEAADRGRQRGVEKANEYTAQADQLAKLETQRKAAEMVRQQKVDAEAADLRRMTDEYGKSTVDSQRMFKNRSTGQAIIQVIAAALLGFAGGKAGNPMAGVQYINGLVDRDIEEQKANISIKGEKLKQRRGLYADMLDRYKDERLAELATKNAMLEQGKFRLAAQAEQHAGEEVGEKTEMMSAELSKQQAQNSQAFAERMYMLEQQPGGSAFIPKATGGGGASTEAKLRDFASRAQVGQQTVIGGAVWTMTDKGPRPLEKTLDEKSSPQNVEGHKLAGLYNSFEGLGSKSPGKPWTPEGQNVAARGVRSLVDFVAGEGTYKDVALNDGEKQKADSFNTRKQALLSIGTQLAGAGAPSEGEAMRSSVGNAQTEEQLNNVIETYKPIVAAKMKAFGIDAPAAAPQPKETARAR